MLFLKHEGRNAKDVLVIMAMMCESFPHVPDQEDGEGETFFFRRRHYALYLAFSAQYRAVQSFFPNFWTKKVSKLTFGSKNTRWLH